MAKYDRLKDYLKGKNAAIFEMSFHDISELVGGLPSSAYTYDAWWANEVGATQHVQCRAWTDAGYKANVDLERRRVSFKRA